MYDHVMDNKYGPKFSEPDIERILFLHKEGRTVPDIHKEMGIGAPSAIRAIIKRSGLTPNPSVRRKIDLTSVCLVCGKTFQAKYVNRGKACSKECTSALIALTKTKYTVSDVDAVVALKRKGLTNSMIEEKTGVELNKIKQIVRENNLFLDRQASIENAQHGKMVKNPNYMEHMRSGLTPTVIENRIIAIQRSYEAGYDHLLFSNHSKKVWAHTKSRPDYSLYLASRNTTLRESKLGITMDEFDGKLLALKADVELNKGTVSTLAASHGLHFVTACREFNRRGWGDLLQRMVSQGQLEVYEYVRSLASDAILNDRSAVPPLELDVYVPSKHVGIEYNGLYWHSSASDAFRRGAHFIKAKVCMEKGVSLLAIFEDEWANERKRDLIKAMIRWRLGRFSGTKLRATALNLVRLNRNSDFEWFFEQNHIDGHTLASYAWALVDDSGKAISCASIRTNHAGEQEIARLATDYNYHVHGGVSKLLSAIPRPIVSYSNNRLSSGAIYRSSGFEEILDRRSAPSYWYTDLSTRVWRFRCKRINDSAVLAEFPSEEKQAAAGIMSLSIFGDDRPLFRIEDYGHRKWILK